MDSEYHSNTDLVQDSAYHTPPMLLTPSKTNSFEATLDNEEGGGGSTTLIKWPPVPNASVLQAEVQFLKEKLISKDEKHAMECEELRETQNKHIKTIEKLHNKVKKYKDQCQELERKLEAKGTSIQPQLPSAVRQLEAKVKELEREKEEMKRNHQIEMQEIVNDNNRQTHRALQLSAGNTLLSKQLEDAQEIIEQLKGQLLTEANNEKEKEQTDSGYVNELATVRNKATTLREELEKMKQDTTSNVELLCGALNSVGEKLKAEIIKEQESYQYLQTQVSSDMQEKESELAKVSTELISLQKDHSIQALTHKELIEGLRLEVASLKLLHKEMEHKAKEELNMKVTQYEEQLASLKTEKDKVVKKLQENTQLLQQTVLSVINSLQKEGNTINEMFESGNCDIVQVITQAQITIEDSVRSLQCKVEKLQSELVISRTKCKELSTQLQEEEMKEKHHYTAADVMKRELDLCQDQLKELSQNKKQLELQIEDIVGQKMDVDNKLSQWQESLALLEKERSTTAQAHTALERTIKEMELEIKEIQNDKNDLEAEVNKKRQVVVQLQEQIIESRSEIQTLQTKLLTLKSEQVDMEKHVFETKTKMESLELEKDLLEKELVQVQQSEESLLKRMMEFQQVNHILHTEKRALQRMLDDMTDNWALLKRKNSHLANEKATQDDVIETLQLTNNELTDRVNELDRNLQEMEMMRSKLKREKTGLKQETVLLNEAFVKTRQTLSEVQIQRSQLNNTVAKIAQEKAALVHEKLQLASNIAHLEGSLKSSLQTVAILSTEKESLTNRVKELEKRTVECDAKMTHLEDALTSLQKDKERELNRHRDEFETMKNSLIMELEKSKQEVLKQKDEIQLKGASYERSMANLKKSQDIELSKLRNNHSHEMGYIVNSHDETVKKFNNKIKALKEENERVKVRLTQEQSLVVSCLEKEKAALSEKIQTEQRLNKERCSELEQEKQEAEIRIDELKIQLKESEKNGEVLSKELNYVEGQIEKLQTVLEQVRIDAETEISQLQTEVVSSVSKIVELEEKNKDSTLAIKHHETNATALKRQLQEAQVILESNASEKESLVIERQNLEQKFQQVESNYGKACETMTCFEKLVEECREEKSQVTTECRRLRNLLAFSETGLAKMTEENDKLQTALTKSEKDLAATRIQLKDLTVQWQELCTSDKELQFKHADLSSRLKIVTLGFETNQEDLKNALETIERLQKENKALGAALEESQLQGKEYSNQLDSLTIKFEELKDQRSQLISTVSTFEACLEKEKKNAESLRQEIAAVKITKTQVEDEFKETLANYQELRTIHNTYLSIIEGAIDSSLVEPNTSMETRGGDDRDRRIEYLTLRNDSCESDLGGNLDLTDQIIISPLPTSLPLSFPVSLPFTPNEAIKSPLLVQASPEGLVQYISKLQNTVRFLQKSNQELTNELEHFQNRLDQLVSQKEHLTESIENLKKNLKENDSSLQNSLKIEKELKAIIDGQRDEIQFLKTEMQNLIVLQKRTKEELELCQVKSKEAIAQLKQTSDAQLAREVEKKEIQSELNRVKLNEMLYKNELDRLQKEKEKWSTLEVKRENIIVELREENKTRELSEKKLKNEIQKLNEELRVTTLKKDELWNAIQKQQDKENEFEGELRSLLSRSIECEETLKGQMEETQCMKTKLKENTQRCEREVHTLKQKLETTEVKKKHLEERLASLQAKVDEFNRYKSQSKAENIEIRNNAEKKLVSLQVSLDAERANAIACKEIQENLVQKIQDKDNELQQLKERIQELCNTLEKYKNSSDHVDGLLLKQAKLTNSLLASSKLNDELTQQLQVKDEVHQKMVLELQQVQKKDQDVSIIGQKLYQTQFEGREAEYKKLITQLERKVKLLNDQLHHIRNNRDELVNKTEKQNRAIATFHKVLSHNDLLQINDRPPTPHPLKEI